MAATTAEKVVESSDIVEDAVELVGDSASWLVSKPGTTGVIAGLTGVLLGSVVTYLVVRSRLEVKYQKIADEQIADVKSKYTVERIVDPKPDLEALAERAEALTKQEEIIERSGYLPYDKTPLAEAVKGLQGESEEEITVTQAIVEATLPIERNVFESDNPDTYFDFREELERREQHPLDPFVITQEEFNDNDTNFDQKTLTYYDGDDVLTDEQDQPLDEMDRVVGVENMLRFGHGSGDPNIVYIRNARLELDFEVVHSDGKFAKEVLGFDDELTHSDRRRPRKFRDSDDG